MSAILGLMRGLGQPVDPALLARMAGAMALRGPDGCGFWHEGPVGLGHLMHRIAPESQGETQPCRHAEAQVVLVADARIDNRDELLEALGIPPRDQGGIPDSRLILEAYLAWGERCPQRLLGAFAFVLWDGRARSLFGATDHTGLRSLVFCEAGGCLAFASEVRGLLALPMVPARLDQTAFAASLEARNFDHRRTFFEGIRRLLPAQCFTAGPGPLRCRTYWRPEPGAAGPGRDWAEEARATFAAAVRCRLRTRHPCGLMLSGGLDSAAIACVAARHLAASGRTLVTVSSVLPADHPGPETDERAFIREVCRQEANIRPLFVTAAGRDPLQGLDAVFDRHCAPVNLFHSMDLALADALAGAGVRVTLTGAPGDGTLSYDGRDSLARLAMGGRWRDWLALGRELGARRGRTFWREAAGSFRARNHGPELLDRAAKGFLFMGGLASDHGDLGMEPCHPFWDKRIVELALRIPPAEYLRDGWPRSLFRRAMAGILPEPVRWRLAKHPYVPDFQSRIASFRMRYAGLIDQLAGQGPRAGLDLTQLRSRLAGLRPDPPDFPGLRTVVAGLIHLQFLAWRERQGIGSK